jgi:hypothetical protein
LVVDILGHLILRLILVPLGVVVASVTAAAFILVAEHNAWRAILDADPDAWIDYLVAFLAGGPGALPLAAFVLYTGVPAVAGVLMAEGFAVRSWIFHAGNGGICTSIGWTLTQGMGDRYVFIEPRIAVAAGLAAGFAYWIIAGRTAGLRKHAPRRPDRPSV